MKSEKVLTFLLFTFSLLLFTSSAAVPLRWTVETSRAVPAQFEAYQGETLDLEAALMSDGKPLEAPSNYSLYWQTNGMGNAWWSVPCNPTIQQSDNPTISNVLFATWSPTNDVGARVYNCFIGQPGTIYHAAFQLRLRTSPGATPNELPLPQKVIDFAKVTVLNPPWSGGGGGGGVDTNAVIDIVHETVEPMIEESIEANEKTGTDQQIVRGEFDDDIDLWNINVNWSYQNEHSDYADWAGGVNWEDVEGAPDIPDVSSKRDITDNTCRMSEGKFEIETSINVHGYDVELKWLDEDDTGAWDWAGWYVFNRGDAYPLNDSYVDPFHDRNANSLSFHAEDWDDESEDWVDALHGTATLSAVCKSNELFVTQGYVDKSISTNNPAFVSSVRAVSPPPSPNLRLYDDVRQCWWIGRMVNGVINWEVE